VRYSLFNLLALCCFVASLLAAETEIEALIAAAEQGDAESQYQLALCFDYGCDAPQDRAAAATWYKRAAEQGHANAQNSLGSLLMAGDGVSQDYAEAMRWYQAAADNDLALGAHNLAYMYDLGLGVSEDNVRAMQLYHTAAEGGHVEAMFNIGLMYAFGDDVKRDYETAYMWLDLARFYTQHSENMQLKWQARGYLDELEQHMTAAQIRAAKSRSSAWYTLHGQ
jgi:TPR repeat protein